MVFILKPNATKQQIDSFIKSFEAQGFSTILSTGTEHTAICLIGNTASVDMDHVVATTDYIEYGFRITESIQSCKQNSTSGRYGNFRRRCGHWARYVYRYFRPMFCGE